MEVYAGFLEHTDHHLGRLLDALTDLEVLDDTLVYYIIGDNEASAEGTINGTFNELISLNGAAALETPEFMAAHMDQFGTPAAYNHYAVGWAHAMDTPYRWTKQVASHWGGTRNGAAPAMGRHPQRHHRPLVQGIQARGELRSQSHHVIDIAATVLEVAGLPEPTMVHGVQQQPLQGTSMVYSFDDPEAAERRTTQYFEMFCNRGIYHQGWTAVTRHSTPWAFGAELPAFDHDVWELYGPEDWTQAHNLANENPRSSRSCSGCSCWKPASTTSSPGRPPGGAVQPGPGRPPPAHPRPQPTAVPRHGPPQRELGGRHQEQVPRHHRPGRDP
jgi:arylsulfatase